MTILWRGKRSNDRVVALHAIRRPPVTGNPFIALTLECFPATVDAVPFSWRRALFGRYDVFHIHWPEALTGGSGPRGLVKKILTGLLIARLALLSTTVVRTVHNLRPHEPSSTIDKLLHHLLTKLTSGWIALNSATPCDATGTWRVIPHGHYRDWFANFSRSRPSRGRICFLGLIRDYKNVPSLVGAFKGYARPDLRLHIAGYAPDSALEEVIRRASDSDDRILLDVRVLSDVEVVQFVTAAELVVLPYGDMHNSGASLLALSLDRPILVPRNDVNDALAAEVGEAWVLRYDPPMSSQVLAKAMTECSAPSADCRPNLDGRGWIEIGASMAACYFDLLRLK